MFEHVSQLIAHYGYFAVFGFVALESAGIPLPGESILVSAAIFAGTKHGLNIAGIITAAAAGAIFGDNIGFWIGREIGLRLLLRYGRYIRLDESKLKLGQYLFLKHGGKIVFFGRFVAVLRAFAALLAGANGFDPKRFFIFNAAGGICWAVIFGTLGYLFGASAHKIAGPFRIVMIAVALVGLFVGWRFYRTHEARLEQEAQEALPGPLQIRRAGSN
ncbi:MAG TPA: DedA family protein [Methylovirgula sp.]|nr:DedA family protein [Methylovirgula sp.]